MTQRYYPRPTGESYEQRQRRYKAMLEARKRVRPGPPPPSGGGDSGGSVGKIVMAIVAAVVLLGGGGGAVVHHEATTPAGGTPDAVALKILAKAKTYDNEHYVFGHDGSGDGGHPPSKYKWGKGLDCSGIINVSVLAVTGIDEDNVAASFRNSKHWKSIKKKDVRAGDIMYILMSKHPGRSSDHVVIVESNKGNGKLNVFAARTSNDDWADQIRGSTGQHYGLYDGALRWKG